MKRVSLICVMIVGALFLATTVFAYECVYQPLVTKKNRMKGMAVINAVDNYCGQVSRQGGGYRVKLEGKKAEFFDRNYVYEEVLQYACDKCGYATVKNLSGQP